MKKKRTKIIIGAAALLIAGGVYLTARSANSQAASTQAAASTSTAQVTRTTLSTSVDSTGSLIPEAEVQLSFGTAGTVNEVNVKVGDQVKQGDVLAALDTTDLQLQVTQAEQTYVIQQLTYSNAVQPAASDVAIAQASYNSALAAYTAALQDYNNLAEKELVQCSQLTSAKTALDQAQTAYDRLANDHQAKNYLSSDWGPFQNVVNALSNAQSAYNLGLANCNITQTGLNDSSLRSAQAQLQSAKSALDSLVSPRAETVIQAQAQLEQARLSVEQAQQNLAAATIVAPFEGVVTAVNITAGGSGSSDAIELADTSKLHVDVLVDETEVASVAPGQKVELTLDALTGMTLTGQVAYIDPGGTISSGVVNYNVRVDLDPTDAPLLLDMTANAAIISEQHANVLAVPTAAIHTASSGQNTSGVQSGQTVTNAQSGFVLVLENGQSHRVPVTVGMTSGDLTEVSGDLKDGDQVVVSTAASTSTNTNNNQGGDFQFGGPPDGGTGGLPPF